MKLNNLVFLLLQVLFSCYTIVASGQSEEGHSLKVKVTNIKKGEGMIRIAAYSPEQEFLGDKIVDGVNMEVNEAGFVMAIFDNLPLGTYALSLYHDQNSNGELDANFFGIPKEPYGFSNDARGTFGPPKYTAAQFEFIKDGQQVEIRVK